MKLSNTLAALAFLALMNLGCSQSITEPITKSDVIEISSTEKETKKFKPTKNMIAINPIKGEYTVKVGQQVYYAARVHGSVGYFAEVSSLGPGLSLAETYTEYDRKQEPGMSGGDAATKYFVFNVLEVGTHTVNAKRYFRGDLEDDYMITIHVEP